jgi:xanthine/CO dehydrogenase XdhC/CoxF family maturation factor
VDGGSAGEPGAHELEHRAGQLAVADDGTFIGSVSGGCIEGAVVHEALEAIKDGKPVLRPAQPEKLRASAPKKGTAKKGKKDISSDESSSEVCVCVCVRARARLLASSEASHARTCICACARASLLF